VFFDDDAVRIAAICDASKVPVGRVVRKDPIRAELLKASLALGTVAVRVNHAAYRCDVARLELGDRRTNLGDTANYFVARDTWIDRATPFATDCMEVRVTDTTEENFNLNIVLAWLSTRDRGRSKR
jgi:hypothetical protein